MRTLFLVLASSVAVACTACDRDANNNQGPMPSGYGGGPPSESQSVYDEGSKAAPAPSATPGDSGTKGEDTTVPKGLNDKGAKKRAPMQQKSLETTPNTTDPTTKY